MLSLNIGQFAALVSLWDRAPGLTASTGALVSFNELAWLVLLICVASVALALLAAVRANGFLTFAGLAIGLIVCATLLASVNDILVFFALWELSATVAWAIGRLSVRSFNAGLGPLATNWIGGLGSLAMLVAISLLIAQSGTLAMDGLHTNSPQLLSFAILAAVSFKSLGLFTMAWFPGRRELFAPANALLAGPGIVMVGIVPYIRLTRIALANDVQWQELVLWTTLAVAALFVLATFKERDLHRIATHLAFSQFLILTAGFSLAGQPAAQATLLGLAGYVAGVVGLFLTVGLVAEVSGTRVIGQMPALARSYPALAILFFLSGVSLVGIPPLVGFASKSLLSVELLAGSSPISALWVVLWLIAALSIFRAFQLAFLHLPAEQTGEIAFRARISRLAIIPPGLAVAVLLCASLWQVDLLTWLHPLATALAG